MLNLSDGYAGSLQQPVFPKDVLWGPQVQSVLLDMDGTLLDRHFDDHFWEDVVPSSYAAKHGLTFGSARDKLVETYRRHEGTLKWTDIDFWSEELGLDIPALKEQREHLIEVHPHVEDFLGMLKSEKKRVYLLTDAHLKVVDLKMRKTKLDRYFDGCLTSFDIGYPKQDPEFWRRAGRALSFDKDTSLFIDDREEILRTAKRFGIRYTLYKANANSKRESGLSGEFSSITEFAELLNYTGGADKPAVGRKSY